MYKPQADTNTAIVRDFHTSLSPVDKSSQQKLITETLKLSDIARRSNTRILNIPCKHILLQQPMTLSLKQGVH